MMPLKILFCCSNKRPNYFIHMLGLNAASIQSMLLEIRSRKEEPQLTLRTYFWNVDLA
jgi:hypothetical protein